MVKAGAEAQLEVLKLQTALYQAKVDVAEEVRLSKEKLLEQARLETDALKEELKATKEKAELDLRVMSEGKPSTFIDLARGHTLSWSSRA